MSFFAVMLLVVLIAEPIWKCDFFKTAVVEQPDQRWRFRQVTAYPNDDNVRVKGRLTAIHSAGLPRGHVDVAAYSPSGDLIVETTTDYYASKLTGGMRKNGGVRFTADLAVKLPPNAVVKVAFHRDEPRPVVNPAHAETVAL